MRVHIGGDHAAYDLKCTLVTFLQGRGYDAVSYTHLTLPTNREV